MGCNCGKGRAGVKYEVTFSNGAPKQTYDSISAAQAAGKASGAPYTFKAVPA